MNNKKIITIIALVLIFIFGSVFSNTAQGESIKESSLKKKISENPNDTVSYLELGKYYQQKKNNDEAIKYLSKAVEIDSKLSDGYFYLSVAYAQKGNTTLMVENMEKACELTPDNPYLLENLVKFYTMSKQRSKALTTYKKMVALNPSKKNKIMMTIADLYETVGFTDDAIDVYNEILKENPKDLDANQRLNFLLNKKAIESTYKEARVEKPVSYVIKKSEPTPNGEMVYEIENSKLKVATFVYRSYYPDLNADYPKNTKNYVNKKFNIRTHDFEKENTDILHRYGYSIGKNAFGDLAIGSWGIGDRILYPKEIDDFIRTSILKNILQNGCSVVDISPIKQSMDSLKLSDIVTRYKTEQNIDVFFVFCYQLYSRIEWISPADYGNGLKFSNEYGLMCQYKMFLIDAKNMENVFEDSGLVRAWMPEREDKNMFGTMKHFQAPIDWLKDNGKKKEGIINGEWLENRMLESLKSTKPVLISGSNKIAMMEVQTVPTKLNQRFNEYFEVNKK